MSSEITQIEWQYDESTPSQGYQRTGSPLRMPRERYTAPGERTGHNLVGEFMRLKDQWRAETMYTSSSSDRIMNLSYQQIIGLGPAVLPLLLSEMVKEPDHWHWALRAITGANPVPPETHGKLSEIARAWIGWGRERGILA